MHSYNITHFIKHGVKHNVHQVWKNKLKVTRYVQNVHHWHEHKHASVSVNCVINQRLLQS